MFIEEISPVSSPVSEKNRSFVAGNPRSRSHTVPCYGKKTFDIYTNKPVLCSGTIIGSRWGINHFLDVLVSEFYANNRKGKIMCKSPHTTDQWTMNWLYYNGKFGYHQNITTIPWGQGPVLTAGKACIGYDRRPGATDIIERDKNGFLLNTFDHSIAPVVHQYDRCAKWIHSWFMSYPEIFQS